MIRKTKSSGLTAEIRVRRCYSCGAILQDKDPTANGYVTSEKFNSGEDVLCERCAKLRQFSDRSTNYDFNQDYITILEDAVKEDALVVYVLNAFCLTGSFLNNIGKFLPEKVLVIVNKRDVLPKQYSDEYLKAYVTKALEKEDINPLEIILTSSNQSDQLNLDVVREAITKYREGKSVYVIGAYQVGKSTLVANFLKGYHNKTNKMIQTIPYPNTSLSVVSVPLDEKTYLFDLPGIYNSKSLVSFVEPQLVKYLIPRTEIKPETYVSKKDQSFLLSNFARIDITEGERTSFTFYKSNDITIIRCKTSHADQTLKNLATNKEQLCVTKKISSTEDLCEHQIAAERGDYRIRIVGLGYFDFTANNHKLSVFAPKQIQIIVEKDGTVISE